MTDRPRRPTGRRALHFVMVGLIATSIHMIVAMTLISSRWMGPLAANVVAWAIAFAASFVGHWQLTFGVRLAPAWQAVRRYLLVSAVGFGVNHAIYSVLLLRAQWSYFAALLVALAVVPVLTYLASRYWAFAPGLEP